MLKKTDVAMPMYNVIQYSDNYSKRSGSLWQYHRDEEALVNDVIVNFPADDNNSPLFIFKQEIAGKEDNNGKTYIEIMVSLKYLDNLWKIFEMCLVYCDINLILTWSVNRYIVAGTVANQVTTFANTDTKRFVPVVTLLKTMLNY